MVTETKQALDERVREGEREGERGREGERETREERDMWNEMRRDLALKPRS